MAIKRVRFVESRIVEADVSEEHVKMMFGRELADAVKAAETYWNAETAVRYLNTHGVGIFHGVEVSAEILTDKPQATPPATGDAPTTLGAPMFVAGPATDEAGESEDFIADNVA